MNRFDRALRGVIQATGGFQVLLGVVFWAGHGLRLIPLHMFVGTLFVLALLVHAARGFATREARGLASLLAVWSVGALAFGMAQAQILPGPYHWVVRVLHLAVGIVAMALAGALGTRIRRARAFRAAPAGASLVHAVGTD